MKDQHPCFACGCCVPRLRGWLKPCEEHGTTEYRMVTDEECPYRRAHGVEPQDAEAT